MKEQFNFNIPNTRAKQIRLLTNLILFLNGLAFCYIGFLIIDITGYPFLIVGALAAISILIATFLGQAKWNIRIIASLLISLDYYWIGAWYLSIIFLGLVFFAETITKKSSIQFNKSTIILKAPFTKTFQWSLFQNIVLRDGLLTLDFKNNKLLQTPIINELTEAETKQFNDFCQERLKAES